MDFVEHIIGFSPDGGTGILELSLLLAFAVPVIVLIRRKRRPS